VVERGYDILFDDFVDDGFVADFCCRFISVNEH